MALGDILSTFDTPGTSPGGLAWDAGLGVLWHVDRTTATISQINPTTGVATAQFAAPDTTPQGLAFDGTNLWVNDDDAELIYKLDPSDGTVLDQFASPGTWPTGLAWDGTALWVADGDDGVIYRLDPADGTVLSQIPSPAPGGSNSAQGLAWDGTALWHVARGGTIYQVDPADGTALDSFTSPGPDARGLTLDPATGDLWHTDTGNDELYRLEGPAPAEPPAPSGGITVDAASPARVTAVSGTQATTAGFDAPAASVLVAVISADSDAADTYSGTVTDSAAGVWTEVVPDSSALVISGQTGYVGMFWRTVDAAAAALTVTATVDSDNGLGIADTIPSLKAYTLNGVDLDHLGSAQVVDVSATFNSVAVTPTDPFTARNLLIVGATEWNDLGAPASNTVGMVVDAFDAAGLSGLSAYLPIGDPPPENFNLNAAGTDPAAWRILATEFAPRLVASLVDPFNAGTITNPPWGNSFNGATITANGLHLPTVAAYSGVETTIGGYILSGSLVFAELSEVPLASAVSQGGQGTGQALLELHDADSADTVGLIRIGWQDDQLRASSVTGTAGAPVFTDHAAIAYSAVDHRFIAVRETGGSITFETSPDGITWTVRATIGVEADLDFGVNNLDIRLTSGEFAELVPSGGNARFEGINVASTIELESIPSAEAWGDLEIVDTVTVELLSIPSAEAWGDLVITDDSIAIVPILSAEAWGDLTILQQRIFLEPIPSGEAWGLLELIAGGLEERQLSWRGLTVGEGTPYIVRDLKGLLDLPELRTSDQPRAQRHGLFAGTDYLGGMVIEGEFVVTGATVAAYRANLAAWQQTMAGVTGERPLRVRYPTVAGGGTRQINARVRRRTVTEIYPSAAVVRVRWDATDPRIYDTTEQTELAEAPGTVTADNVGTLATPWRLRIVAGAGGCTDPAVTRVDQPATFLAFDVTLVEGEVLEVDVDQRTVLRNGINAYAVRTIDSSWFELPPGSTGLSFTVASGAADLVVTLRSAWAA